MKLPDWLQKEQLYEIIFESETKRGKLFDEWLIFAILLSLIVSFVKSVDTLLPGIKDGLTIAQELFTVVFTLEYIARVYCSPRKRDYMLSFFGIVDLLAILPSYLGVFFPSLGYMIILRVFRFLRIFRVFKLFTFINEGYLLLASIRKSLNKILVYFFFVLILVTIIGTLMFMVESGVNPNFSSIGTSIYWAIVTMTTVGYGDITPVTGVGKVLSAFVMLLGYTIIAVPTGIVSATIIDETNRKVVNNECPRCGERVEKRDRYCSHCGEKL